jgi:predicted nucleic-acid-binding protein
MFAIDTNVLVRLLAQDDRRQSAMVARWLDTRLDEGDSVLISSLVLLECEWVLRSRYGLAKPDIAAAFDALLNTPGLVFDNEPSIERALQHWSETNGEFADCLIAASNQSIGAVATMTFDRKSARIPGMSLLAE